MNKDIVHCGVVTTFVYTLIYIAKEDEIIEYQYIKNIFFQKEITDILDFFLHKYNDIAFFSIFLGPAPLLSCRTTLVFMKGLSLVVSLPIVVIRGNNFFKYSYFDSVIIQNFCGMYLLIEKNKKNKLMTILEMEQYNYKNKRIGLVSREGHSIKINEHYVTILFPNINSIIKKSYKKFQEGKTIKSINEIKPFL
jgi:hypothetical protein